MRLRGKGNSLRGMIAGLALAAMSVAGARADAISDFYEGKTFTIVIGYPPGGAYDLYARTIARHLGKHVPGRPSVTIQNLPGAASLAATNHVAVIGQQDGLAMAAVGAALPFTPMLDPQAARFEATKLNWMPSPASFVALMTVWHTAPAKTFEELKTNEVLMGTLNPGAAPSFHAAIVNDVLKTKIKLVYGYDSMSAAMLAMQRGEAQGYPTAPIDSIKRAYANLVTEGKVRFVLQLGGKPSPEFPDVPFVLDQAKTPDDRLLLDIAMGSLKIGYPYLMGPNAPRERVQAIRDAMMKTFADPEFRADAARQTLDVNPVSGAEVQGIVAAAYGAPQPLVERLRAIYQRQVR